MSTVNQMETQAGTDESAVRSLRRRFRGELIEAGDAVFEAQRRV